MYEKLNEKLKSISTIREEYKCAKSKYLNAQREIFEIQKEKFSCLVGGETDDEQEEVFTDE